MIRKYSVTFVLPSPSIGYPPGGYNIVYQLAHYLNKSGIKTAIIFLVNASVFTSDLKLKILRKVFHFLFSNRRIKMFYRLRLYKLLRVAYDYSILDNVDCFYYNSVKDVMIRTDLIIATAWETAYTVNEIVNNLPSKPFYLVLHSEDDPSFSGINSTNAEKTYHFNFTKIVINRKVYERFKEEHPLFFHVGINTNFFMIKEEINKRENVILLPLRKGESKGGKYAIECARKLLTCDAEFEIKIIMFGNYKVNEIPIDIRNKVEYYHSPTNKILRKLYNKSSIFVLPSIVEGMSLPPLEAMACGCAVIVTNNGGINEYIVNDVNGLICPIRDSECLYSKVLFLLNNKLKMEELINNGIETAKNFSYEQMNANFLSLIKKQIK